MMTFHIVVMSLWDNGQVDCELVTLKDKEEKRLGAAKLMTGQHSGRPILTVSDDHVALTVPIPTDGNATSVWLDDEGYCRRISLSAYADQMVATAAHEDAQRKAAAENARPTEDAQAEKAYWP